MSTEKVIEYSKVGEVLKEISRKINDRVQTHIWMPIKCLGCNIPIREVSKKEAENILTDYIERQCHCDLSMARSNVLMWKAHTISMCIPGHEELMSALYGSSYMTAVTESFVITQIYLEIISLNPHLDWNCLCWPEDPHPPSVKSREVHEQVLSSIKLLRTTWVTNCYFHGELVRKSFDKLIKSMEDFKK